MSSSIASTTTTRRLAIRRRGTARASVLAAVVLATLAGCATQAPLSRDDLGASSRLTEVYRLGVGDKIKVNVFGEDNLSGTYEISPTGVVAMPLIGAVPARGLTVDQFRSGLAQKLSAGYLRNPRIAVDVANYRPIYVHGEVRAGGEFPYKPGLRLRDAIALAGGYSYRADESHLVVLRSGSDQPVRVRMPTSAEVMPGDNIRVPERFF